jgi:hypothetical protein
VRLAQLTIRGVMKTLRICAILSFALKGLQQRKSLLTRPRVSCGIETRKEVAVSSTSLYNSICGFAERLADGSIVCLSSHILYRMLESEYT